MFQLIMKKENIIVFMGILLIIFSFIMLFVWIRTKNSEMIAGRAVTEFDNYKEEIKNIANKLKESAEEERDMFSSTDKPHWKHMPLVYKFNEERLCEDEQKKRIKSAFQEVEKETKNIINFAEGDNPDIIISCYHYKKESEYFLNKTIGEANIFRDNNIIDKAIINLYQVNDSCNLPSKEIHEILHVFGYQHTEDENSILYPEENCKDRVDEEFIIDKDIIKGLIEIYGKKG